MQDKSSLDMQIQKAPKWLEIDRAIINLAGEWVGMGNVIMTSPLVEAIHRVAPKCKIYILITGKSWVPIVKLMKGFPKPIVVNKDFYRLRFLYLNGILRLRRPWLKTVYFYDYLAPCMRASLFGKLAGAQYRFGYGEKDDRKECNPLNNTMDLPFSSAGLLSFDYSSKFQTITGLRIKGGPKLERDRLVERGNNILENLGVKNRQRVIAFHPGCSLNNKIKRWPVSSFSKLAQVLTSISDATVLIILGSEENDLKNEWRNPNCVKFMQGYPLLDVAAVLACVDGIVSNDSGIMHLAFALGIPGVGVFGPTTFENYTHWYPRAKFVYSHMNCRPCYGTDRYGECGQFPAPCIHSISVREVASKLQEIYSYKLK